MTEVLYTAECVGPERRVTEVSHAGDLSVGSEIGGHSAVIGRVLEAPRMPLHWPDTFV